MKTTFNAPNPPNTTAEQHKAHDAVGATWLRATLTTTIWNIQKMLPCIEPQGKAQIQTPKPAAY